MKKNKFILKTTFVCVASLLVFKAVSFAEAFGPVGKAMHAMSEDMECLTGGELASFLCDFDSSNTPAAAAKNKKALLESARDFAQSAKAARNGLVAFHAGEADKVQTLNTLFDSLDNAANRMITAVSNDDSEALKAAIADVDSIRDSGHKQFNPKPVGPGVQ